MGKNAKKNDSTDYQLKLDLSRSEMDFIFEEFEKNYNIKFDRLDKEEIITFGDYVTAVILKKVKDGLTQITKYLNMLLAIIYLERFINDIDSFLSNNMI